MKNLILIIALTAMPHSYSMNKKSKTVPQRWTLDKPQLEKEIKRLFYLQYVLRETTDYIQEDWLKLARNNPFLAQELKAINYECFCYKKNDDVYKDFCEKYKINYISMDDMENIIDTQK